MKYKIIIHEMLVVYRITVSFRGGCIYKSVDIIAVRVWCQDLRHWLVKSNLRQSPERLVKFFLDVLDKPRVQLEVFRYLPRCLHILRTWEGVVGTG